MSTEWGMWAVMLLTISALLAAAVARILRYQARRRRKGRQTFLWYR